MKRVKKKKTINEKRLVIKTLLCLVYFVIITVLFACSYKLFQQKNDIVPWSDVESVDDYSYMTIYKMSEKFAYYKDANIGIHFIIEKEDTGQWHTYLIAIDESKHEKYKAIIDYTYERTNEAPEPIKVYGYPVNTNDELRKLAINNIKNFVPATNEVVITEDNYEAYLTNSYLDTTKQRQDNFDIFLFITLLLLFIVIGLLIITIFDKDKIVDNIDSRIDKEINKVNKLFKRKKQPKKE